MIPGITQIVDWYSILLQGFSVSLQLTAASLIVGIPLGLLLALGVQHKSRLFRVISLVVVEVGRGTPALVLLLFIYYGVPSAGLALSSFVAAVVALGWNTAAYTSEVIRAALQSVPSGQEEAGKAAGLSSHDVFRFVVLPQATRIAMPGLLGFSILIFQGTALAYVISVPELMSVAYGLGYRSFEYLTVFGLAALLYAIVTIPATLIVSYMERQASRYWA